MGFSEMGRSDDAVAVEEGGDGVCREVVGDMLRLIEEGRR